MLLKRLKVLLAYAMILVAGVACGYVAINLPNWLKSPYTEGNFQAYFPDSKTQVVVYGTKSCQFCAKTREYLKSANVAFADLDIEGTEKAKAEFMKLGGGGVPLILIGNRRIVGFNKAVIEESLAKLDHKLAAK
jgi:mycoredoxin